MELYFAVSGIGAVLHTVNPRLFPEQIDYILNHAESRALFFDITFADLVGRLAPKLTHLAHLVAMTDKDHMPGTLPAAACYETLLAAESDDFAWPQLDERTASSLCYTSGTTGNPKGVLYSHRSTVLHSFIACAADGLRLSSADRVLLVVPLFHVNAWGIPYAAAMCGATLVLPGPQLDGKSIFELAARERCNFSLGVPTVWLSFFKYLDETPGLDLSQIKLQRVVVGGSAAPRAIIERFHRSFGAFTIHAWGMSETSPLGSIGNLLPKHRDLPPEDQISIQTKQGRAIYGVELCLTGPDGAILPHDGKAAGDLKVRGPWVASGYFKGEGGAVLDPDGWFSTGDVATIDPDGFIQITDRSKDVIKSGGEWISSIDLENAAVAHPAVQEAAVIGLPHAKWQERPLLVVVRKPGARRRRRSCLPSSGRASPNGKCRTTSRSSTSCRTPLPASCRRPNCANSFATTSCRLADFTDVKIRDTHLSRLCVPGAHRRVAATPRSLTGRRDAAGDVRRPRRRTRDPARQRARLCSQPSRRCRTAPQARRRGRH
jgi:acyl-CoA synthetase (AMP-forming)/AMP-acid ligase II